MVLERHNVALINLIVIQCLIGMVFSQWFWPQISTATPVSSSYGTQYNYNVTISPFYWTYMYNNGGYFVTINKDPALPLCKYPMPSYPYGSFLSLVYFEDWVSYSFTVNLQSISNPNGIALHFSNNSGVLLYISYSASKYQINIDKWNKFTYSNLYSSSVANQLSWEKGINIVASVFRLNLTITINNPSMKNSVYTMNVTLPHRFVGGPAMWGCGLPVFSYLDIEDYDECAAHTHDCDTSISVCVNTQGDFSCICNPGWQGGGLGGWSVQSCTEINECALYGCGSNGTCFNTAPNTRFCQCPPSMYGNQTLIGDAIHHGCTTTDNCQLYQSCNNQTNATCTAGVNGTRICSCMVGFSPTNVVLTPNMKFSNECKDIDECQVSEPEPICPFNAECVNTVGSFYCKCLPGYRNINQKTEGGNIPCVDTDECTYNTSNECNGTECQDGYIPTTRYCKCPSGYSGTVLLYRNETFRGCNDINECLSDTHDCEINSTECINLPGTYFCRCLPGFIADNTTDEGLDSCQEINECALHGCNDTNAQCTQNQPNYRQCICKEPLTNFSKTLNGSEIFPGCCPSEKLVLLGNRVYCGKKDFVGMVIDSPTVIVSDVLISGLSIESGSLTVMGDLSVSMVNISSLSKINVTGCMNASGTLNIQVSQLPNLINKTYELMSYNKLCLNSSFSNINVIGNSECAIGQSQVKQQSLSLVFVVPPECTQDQSQSQSSFPYVMVASICAGCLLLLILVFIAVLMNTQLKSKIFPYRREHIKRIERQTRTSK